MKKISKLNRNAIYLSDECWYYEEKKGLSIVCPSKKEIAGQVVWIKVKKLRDYLKRLDS